MLSGKKVRKGCEKCKTQNTHHRFVRAPSLHLVVGRLGRFTLPALEQAVVIFFFFLAILLLEFFCIQFKERLGVRTVGPEYVGRVPTKFFHVEFFRLETVHQLRNKFIIEIDAITVDRKFDRYRIRAPRELVHNLERLGLVQFSEDFVFPGRFVRTRARSLNRPVKEINLGILRQRTRSETFSKLTAYVVSERVLHFFVWFGFESKKFGKNKTRFFR